MRLLASALLTAVSCTAKLTSSSPGQVVLYDPHLEPRPASTLSPIAARLVLAQRAGVEDFHQADVQREDVLNAINKFGAQTPLFSTAEERSNTAFILSDAAWVALAELDQGEHTTTFKLDPAPNAADMQGLFIDLAKQSNPRDHSLEDDDTLLHALSKPSQGEGDMFYVAQSATDLQALYNRLIKTGGWNLVVLSTQAEKSGEASIISGVWGTYEMPNTQSPLKKRQQKEEPLTETHDLQAVHSTSVPFTPLADSTPLRGILPACFTSQAACERETRNCTGHGHCNLKYHDSTARVGSRDCYSCVCPAIKDGKTTTQWAGPACQKKDISVQFWLITLFTVGLVFVVGFAVGTIWEMGDQELPSVIGAGVSGPTARK